jgi:hypothetical protein
MDGDARERVADDEGGLGERRRLLDATKRAERFLPAERNQTPD